MKKISFALLLLLAACSPDTSGKSEKTRGGHEKTKVISKGSEFLEGDYLVDGHVTILDFYADWCPPCRTLSPQLEALAQKHDKVLIRKVDIVGWESDAARQGMEDFGFQAIPHVVVFDGTGREVDGITGAQIHMIEQAVENALQP